MTEFETAQVTIDQIEELEEIIAYSVETSGSITADSDGGVSGTVSAKTIW
ncbi:hypothetical protein [Caulobacter sp. BP25]|nr:hypothetical protein [Caulobacter sp. BP25]